MLHDKNRQIREGPNLPVLFAFYGLRGSLIEIVVPLPGLLYTST